MTTVETQRSGQIPNPVAVGIGCVVGLMLISFALARSANSVSWTLYTLADDLSLASLLLWLSLLLWASLASVFQPVRRAGLPFGCLLGAPPCRRVERWTWLGLMVLAAGAASFPGMVPSSHLGLTLRVGQPWRSVAASDPGRLVTRLALGVQTPPWTPTPHVALSGWIFAPVSGEYHFELAALGDALLEVDGEPFLEVGAPGVEMSRAWVTDPSGARRAEGKLAAGFHRVRLFYRQGDGTAAVRLRWTPPYVARPRPIPVRYLLADGTPPETRWRRTAALTCRRIGIAALAVLGAVPLSGLVARALAWARPSGPRPADRRISRDEAMRRA